MSGTSGNGRWRGARDSGTRGPFVPLLDPQHAATLQTLGLDDEGLQQLVGTFASTGQESLAAITAAIADANHAALLREAHKLKGCALMFAAQRVSTTAAALETVETDWDSATELLAQLEDDLSETVRALKSLSPIDDG